MLMCSCRTPLWHGCVWGGCTPYLGKWLCHTYPVLLHTSPAGGKEPILGGGSAPILNSLPTCITHRRGSVPDTLNSVLRVPKENHILSITHQSVSTPHPFVSNHSAVIQARLCPPVIYTTAQHQGKCNITMHSPQWSRSGSRVVGFRRVTGRCVGCQHGVVHCGSDCFHGLR